MTGEYEGDGYQVFVGVGRADEAEAGGSPLERAFEAAYEKGKNATGKTDFRVVEIQVAGTNPINEYRVVLHPRG